MAIIPEFFFDAVVSIGEKDSSSTDWIGTGFLVGNKDVDSSNYSVFLITNYHVIKDKEEIVVRFNKKDENSIKDYEIYLIENNCEMFSKHPHADVIAIQISASFLERDNSEFSFFDLDRHALLLNDMKSSGVIEGNIIYSLGFPMNMVGTNRKNPICRIGCISRISDLFTNQHRNEYLIDLQAVPGNSGAPVINRPDNMAIDGTPCNSSANLIGIVCGTINYRKKSELSSECQYPISSGIAIVHPVDIIKEVIQYEYIRIRTI